MRDLLEAGTLLKSGATVEKATSDDYIPVTQKELNWYKNRLDDLSLKQRMKNGTSLLEPSFHGFKLRVEL